MYTLLLILACLWASVGILAGGRDSLGGFDRRILSSGLSREALTLARGIVMKDDAGFADGVKAVTCFGHWWW